MPKRNFDAVAATWDDNPGRRQVAAAIAQAIRAAVALRPDMTLLDYGAGTGLVTLALQPEVGEIVAADSSEGMLEALRVKLAAAGLTNVRPLHLDLETEDLPSAAFDVIVSSMTFHHLQNPQTVLTKLAAALAPGGTIAVADLDAGSEQFHPDNTGVFHFGFGADQMRAMFTAAGLHDVAVTEAVRIPREARDFPVLLTVGHK
jgi:ubiquinone/menaquinone biosynthesis C-methylase UbiE